MHAFITGKKLCDTKLKWLKNIWLADHFIINSVAFIVLFQAFYSLYFDRPVKIRWESMEKAWRNHVSCCETLFL